MSAWRYASLSGGIVDTTAVTIAPAVVGMRNYIDSLQVFNSGAAGTEVIIRDGSLGPVLWRGYVGATTASLQVDFKHPIKGSINTLLEVVLSSGTTVAVRINVQGHLDV